jgi:cephalosporin hydroxylase
MGRWLARQLDWYLFEKKAFGNTEWLGIPIWKEPTDLWVYQHIVSELRPDLIIETGTLLGGSALYLASLCDLMDRGRVVSVDIEHIQPLPQHRRIEYILGSSTAPDIVDRLRKEAGASETVLVILDSDHRYGHVIEELRLYAPLVTKGSYIIVEDTLFDYTASTGFLPGPAAATREFLAQHKEFEFDISRECYLMTQNPGGYLRRLV